MVGGVVVAPWAAPPLVSLLGVTLSGVHAVAGVGRALGLLGASAKVAGAAGVG